MQPIKALLIDPFVMSVDPETENPIFSGGDPVREIEIVANLANIYAALTHKKMKVDHIEGVPLRDNGDLVYVDEEGLFKEDVNHWWGLVGWPHPIRGRGIVFGSGKDGNEGPPITTKEDIVADLVIGAHGFVIPAKTMMRYPGDHNLLAQESVTIPVEFPRFWSSIDARQRRSLL